MSTDTPIFPECPGYGFTSQPQYLVNIVRREGGYERSDRRWSRPLNIYSAVPMGPRDEAEIQNVLYFWHAMGGKATTFAFKDWTDYKSCPTWGTPAHTDSPLVAVTLDSGTAYQLTKEYTVGSLHGFRDIYKPIGSTVIVGNEDGDLQTDWTLDQDTGLLKPGGTFTGTPTTWGGEFNIPVRFNSDLAVEITNKELQSVEFTLAEKRLPAPTTFAGDSGGGSEGIVWTDVTPYDDITFYKVIFGGSKLLALGNGLDGLSLYVSSDDGDSWTVVLPNSTSNVGFFPCISYGNGRFIMAGADATSGDSIVYTSDDGTTWTARTAANIGAINGVVYGSGSHWVATSADSFPSKYATSSDNGATWIDATVTVVDQFYGNPMYYQAGKYSTIGIVDGTPSVIASTDNGATWTATPFTGIGGFSLSSNPPYFFDGSLYIIGGEFGVSPGILSSSTPEGLATATGAAISGLASSAVLGVIKAGGVYFAFTDPGEVANSTDGLSWGVGDTGTGDDPLSQGQQSIAFNSGASKITAMMNANMIRQGV